MLCLTRRREESFFIGDSEVKVIGIGRGRVRLGITAKRGVPIERDEVRRRLAAGEPLHQIEQDLDQRENTGVKSPEGER